VEKSITSLEESPRLVQRVVAVIGRTNWTTLLVGVTIGIVGLHLTTNHSLNQRLNGLESEFRLVRAGLDDVAGSRTGVDEANDLLAALTEQRTRLNSARASLTDIDRLATGVSGSSAKAAEAKSALDRLTALNNDLIATGRRQAEVTAAIDGVRELQSRVAGIGDDSQQALTRLEEARRALTDLEQFQKRVCQTTTDLQQARHALEAVIALQCDLTATDGATTRAQAAADRLIALKDNLNSGSDQLEAAEENAERLIVLKDDVAGHGDRLQAAEQNAERLIQLQDQLVSDERLQFLAAASNVERLIRIQAEIASQTDGLTDSITALEVLDDFQTEFNGQAVQVQEMRRRLTELVLLQTTIEQVLQAVEPISELGNLRRLDPAEIQEAARIILDQRRARLARLAEPTDVATADPADAPESQVDSDDRTQSESPDTGIHAPEIHRPVPEPPDEM
jgi:GTP1/Obg family GTP-binding protein